MDIQHFLYAVCSAFFLLVYISFHVSVANRFNAKGEKKNVRRNKIEQTIFVLSWMSIEFKRPAFKNVLFCLELKINRSYWKIEWYKILGWRQQRQKRENNGDCVQAKESKKKTNNTNPCDVKGAKEEEEKPHTVPIHARNHLIHYYTR